MQALIQVLGVIVQLILDAHAKGELDEYDAVEAAAIASKLARFHTPV